MPRYLSMRQSVSMELMVRGWTFWERETTSRLVTSVVHHLGRDVAWSGRVTWREDQMTDSRIAELRVEIPDPPPEPEPMTWSDLEEGDWRWRVYR